MLIKYIVNAEWAIWKTIFCKYTETKVGGRLNIFLHLNFKEDPYGKCYRKEVTRDKNIDTHDNSPYCYGLIRLYNVQNGLGSNRNRLQFFLIKLVNMNEQSLV